MVEDKVIEVIEFDISDSEDVDFIKLLEYGVQGYKFFSTEDTEAGLMLYITKDDAELLEVVGDESISSFEETEEEENIFVNENGTKIKIVQA